MGLLTSLMHVPAPLGTLMETTQKVTLGGQGKAATGVTRHT